MKMELQRNMEEKISRRKVRDSLKEHHIQKAEEKEIVQEKNHFIQEVRVEQINQVENVHNGNVAGNLVKNLEKNIDNICIT